METPASPITTPPMYGPTVRNVYGSYAERVTYASIIGLISVVGTIGNCLVLIAAGINKKLRTKTNIMVVNLSVADLISCISLPWMCVAVLSEEGWMLPSWICKLQGAILILCTGCSSYTLAGIAVSRCYLITMPRARYYDLFTTSHITAMVILCWLIPVAVIVVAISYGTDFLGYDEKYSFCTWNTQQSSIKKFSLILMLTFYPIPFTAILISSVKIWWFVRQNTRRITAATSVREGRSGASIRNGATATTNGSNQFKKRQMSVTKNLFLVIAAFLVLIGPYSILIVSPGGAKLIPAFAVILLSNSCVNPIIYARHPDFRIAFKQFLRCNTANCKTPRDISSLGT